MDSGNGARYCRLRPLDRHTCRPGSLRSAGEGNHFFADGDLVCWCGRDLEVRLQLQRHRSTNWTIERCSDRVWATACFMVNDASGEHFSLDCGRNLDVDRVLHD